MNMLRRWLSFPLLAKELTERAARNRTYWVRVLFAVGAFLVFALMFFRETDAPGRGSDGPFGIGGDLLANLFLLQFAGIYLFQPALMAGVITHEKERDSFSALLLTDMSPSAILVQKFIGGLLPMLNLLLITLPLCGLAYAYGGISSTQLLVGTWLILGACLQVGALALMCSAYCRTTTAALIATYIVGVVSYALTMFSGELPAPFDAMAGCYFPIPAIDWAPEQLSRVRSTSLSQFWVPLSTPALSAVLFLLVARYYLVRHAFLPNRPAVASAFRRWDRRFARWNRLLGDIRIGKGTRSLPTDQPVAWREFGRSALGRPEHLLRIGVGLSILSCIAAFFTEIAVGLFALVGLFLVIIRAANLVTSERIDQTLDILLTTPIGRREIVAQKWLAVRLLSWVLSIPVIAAIAVRLVLIQSDWTVSDPALVGFIAPWILGLAVYPFTFGWMATLIGVRTRSQMRAVMLSLLLSAVWIFGPFMADSIFQPEEWGRAFPVLSPAFVLRQSPEFHFVGDFGLICFAVINFVIFLLIGLLFRRLALRSAEKHLGK